MEKNKKYRWNVITFMTNIIGVLLMLTTIGMLVTFFAAPAMNIEAETLRTYMLTMSNIMVIEIVIYFILWLKNRFF